MKCSGNLESSADTSATDQYTIAATYKRLRQVKSNFGGAPVINTVLPIKSI